MSAPYRKARGALLAIFVILASVGAAAADPILSYRSTTPGLLEPLLSADTDTLHPSVTPSPLQRGPGLQALGWSWEFASIGWTVGGDRGMAVSEGSYLSWGFTADAPVDPGLLEFGYRREAHGPRNLALDVSLDNGATWQTVFQTDVRGANALTAEIDLAAQGLGGATDVQFRLIGWNARREGAALRLQNVIEVPGSDTGRAVVISGAPAVLPADLDARKTVRVHSQDGAACTAFQSVAPATPRAAIPGACIEYRIETDNSGGRAAESVRIVDQLGPQMTFIDARVTGFDTSAPGYALTLPPSGSDCAATACEIRMEDAALDPGAQGDIVIRALLK